VKWFYEKEVKLSEEIIVMYDGGGVEPDGSIVGLFQHKTSSEIQMYVIFSQYYFIIGSAFYPKQTDR
jgi:hypothetical protein